ncbi:hypothetical protein HPS36_09510 [Halorubrum salinarum]|uniref:RDD family protein n=1 Tax=Halorubrum salinarum TaxID=2739057 RepID=A0A7D3Y0Y4_9EURY|nr:hypothetical protein [Halorubrum salinarum]QKG93087.1 hypothetical protein HPS36_09510 [Halorubrum salinarum]
MSTPYARSQLASVTARGGAWLIDIVASVAVAAVVRNVTKILGGPSLLLILAGVVFIADSPDNQRLGDRWADTLVVRV